MWIGTKEIAFILADVTGDPENRFPAPPTDWEAQVRRRVLNNPTADGFDGSLRAYIRNISFGKARLTGDVYGPFRVAWDTQGGCFPTARQAIVAARGLIEGYSYACVVFTARPPCSAWAFYAGTFAPGSLYAGSTVTDFSYVNMNETVGVWAMENTHVVSRFGDLYGRPYSPGSFDNMDCACGTHPSSFTKMKLGW